MASNDVLIKLVADVSGLNKELSSVKKQLENVEKTTSNTGSTLASTFKKVGTVVAGAFAVSKIKDFTISMIEATAKVNALDSMFEQTFKGDQAKALEGITEQAKIQGVNIDRLKGSWSSFYGTFRGNGADANESLQLTSRYMSLAGDGAAYYDMNLEEVVSRLKSVTMGNFEAGDAIGININATKMNAIATEKLGKKWQDLNDTEKEFLLIDTAEKIYENSGAMGQGSREANNWENVLANLKSTWERLNSILGQPALKIATAGIMEITDSLSGAVVWLQQFQQGFQDGYNATGNFTEALAYACDTMGLETLGDAVAVVGGVIEEAVDKAKSFASWFSEMGTGATILAGSLGALVLGLMSFNIWLNSTAIALKFQSIYQGVYNTIVGIGTGITSAFSLALMVLSSPFFWIGVAIAGVIAIGVLLYKNWDLIKAKAGELGAWIGQKWNEIVTWTSEAWTSVVSWISGAWTSIVSGVSAGFSAVIQWFTDGWNSVVSICSTVWEFIKNVISVGILAVVSIVEALFQLITLPIMFVWENIKEYIFQAWEWISTTVTNGINAVINAVVTFFTPIIQLIADIWNKIVEATTGAWNSVKDFLTSTFTYISGLVSTVWNNILTAITTVFNAIKTLIINVWEAIKSFFVQVFNYLSNLFITAFNNMKNTVVSIFNAIKSTITSIWNSISATTSSVWNGINSAVSNIVNSVKNTISNVFNSVYSTVTSIWNKIKSAMTQPIEEAKNKIAGLVNAVKGLFNFTLTFPKPKMPHFSLSGSFSLAPPSVPRLSVDWYKTGGIATGSSIVGLGENGDEAIVPLSDKHRMLPFASAVASMMPDKEDDSSGSAGIIIQVENLVVREEADVKRIAEELFKLQERNRRKRGVVNA